MKKLLALLIALMTVLLCSCSSGGETIRFGAAGTGGIYNEAANSIKSFADADGTLKIETKTTAGSAANVRLLSQNYLDAELYSPTLHTTHLTAKIILKNPAVLRATALLQVCLQRLVISL